MHCIILPHILVDNEVATSLAIQHVLRSGHTKIGHITAPEDTVVGAARMRGIKFALTHAHLPLAPDHIIRDGFTVEHGRQAAHLFMALKSRPTAILCANDECAMSLISELYAHDVRVPDDVSVMGLMISRSQGCSFLRSQQSTSQRTISAKLR